MTRSITREISNYDDVIDSRDVIERIEELEGQDSLDPDEVAELKALVNLAEEAEGYSEDWRYGAPLVRDSYWRGYAEEWFDDVYGHELGAVHDSISAYVTVDYDMFARDLQMDYSAVEFDGVTYWIR